MKIFEAIIQLADGTIVARNRIMARTKSDAFAVATMWVRRAGHVLSHLGFKEVIPA